MTISIGADHAGVEYKKAILTMLKKMGHKTIDRGTSGTKSVDYPDFIHPVATDLEKGKADLGVIICGSGNGVAITANKHQQIRAALSWNMEIAELARAHNNANIVAIPARFVSENLAKEIVKTFLNTSFEGGRHQRRVDKIPVK